MRSTLSPTFTSSKLKNMMSLVDDTGKQIVDFYSEQMNESENKGMLLKYTCLQYSVIN